MLMMMMGYGVENSSCESELEEEQEQETTNSYEEGLVVLDEDEDFGLPEMVIFVHERIYRACKEVGMCEDEMQSRCLMKCLNETESRGEWCVDCDGSASVGWGEDGESCGSGIVSYDERMNVYKKVILVREVEELIRCSPRHKSNKVGVRGESKKELLGEELDQYAAKESFYFDTGYQNGLKDLNGGPPGYVQKFQSLKELLSMTSQVDNATNIALSPPPMAYSMPKSDTGSDLGQPWSSRRSFSFPILAKEWFGSPVRMADNSSKFSLQGLLRYFRCCSFKEFPRFFLVDNRRCVHLKMKLELRSQKMTFSCQVFS